MKILFDTNVVLDLLLRREPYADVAIRLFSAIEQNLISGVLCATTITTLDYLVAKAKGKQVARQAIQHLLQLFVIAEVNQQVLQSAANSAFDDFEDAVLYQSGCYALVDGFVSRNIKDFKQAELPVYCPDELWGIIQTINNPAF